jgi:monoterpene epsilon-lactone hydrolase
MSSITLQGKLSHKLRSCYALISSSVIIAGKRAIGKNVVHDWKWDFEVAMLFWRKQMMHAFSLPDITEARQYIDSLLFDPINPFDGQIRAVEAGQPVKGRWFIPREPKSSDIMLYFHGGGYAFYAKSHEILIANIAQAAGLKTFALDYRLTPEHAYPAQIEDGVAAFKWLLNSGVDPQQIVIAGDSAGGHLAMEALLAFRDAGLAQPALAIGICPWVDIGRRGRSFFFHDRYDWVQGYMAIKFGEWLKGNTGFSDKALSPINRNFKELAPIYLQAGGREILFDMIHEFASVTRAQGAEVTLDVWKNMTHDFQSLGSYIPESKEALKRIGSVVQHYLGDKSDYNSLPSCPNTVM